MRGTRGEVGEQAGRQILVEQEPHARSSIGGSSCWRHLIPEPPALDDWLKRRALANEAAGGSRTYIVCGYYVLAAGGVAQAAAPGRVRRNRPDPVPVMMLGRLAVDQVSQGRGLGTGLLRDAILRTRKPPSSVWIRAIFVHDSDDHGSDALTG